MRFAEIEIIHPSEADFIVNGNSIPSWNLPPAFNSYLTVPPPSMPAHLTMPPPIQLPPCPPPPLISFSPFSVFHPSSVYPPLPPPRSPSPLPPPPRSMSQSPSPMDICSLASNSPSPNSPNNESDPGPTLSQLEETTEPVDSNVQARQESFRRCLNALVHAHGCRDANCFLQSCQKMKRVIEHTRSCQLKSKGGCSICKKLCTLCAHHAKHCTVRRCNIPFCMKIREKLKQQLKDIQKIPSKEETGLPNVFTSCSPVLVLQTNIEVIKLELFCC